MKKLVSILSLLAMISVASAALVPAVGNGTAPNQWTKNVEGVLKEATKTGYPIFVLIINDSNAGEGCSHCASFLSSTINTSQFEALKRSNTFYMVLLNYWQGANGYHNNIGPYHSRWRTQGTGIYANADVLPDIAVVDPRTGRKHKGWGVPWGDGGNRTAQIKAELDKFVPHTSKFGLESVSASTTVAQGDSWQGRVVRSGGSGLNGSARLSLGGAHAGFYTVTPSSLSWGTADGAQAFSVSGPSNVVDAVLYDEITVSLNGECPGGDVAYGVREMKLTFKDARIAKTLAEFSAAHEGLERLSASNAVWFVSTNAAPLALETVIDGEDVLTLNATKPGKLTLALPAAMPETTSASVIWIPASGASETRALVGTDSLTVGVSVGDKVEMKFTSSVPKATVGFATLEFAPLNLSLQTPADGASFGWPDVCANPALVDFAWESNADAPDYKLYLTQGGSESVFSGTPVEMGESTATNGVAAGLVVTNTVMGTCSWGVKVEDSSSDIGVASTTQVGSFAITAKPEYDSTSASVTAYLKCGTDYDFSARAPAGTGPISYSVTGLPAGMSFDARTGRLTGTPKKAGTYTVTITASNNYGSVTKTVVITAAKLPKTLNGSYNGVFFAGATMPYSMTWKISTSGKWTGKILQPTAKTKSVKGTVVLDEDGHMRLESPDLTIRQIPGTALWTASWGGATLYGKMTAKLDSSLTGIWTSAAQAEGGVMGGYASSKISSNGKISFSGKICAKQKFSGNGQSLLLTGAEIAAYAPDWAREGRTGVFVHGAKKTSGRIFNGGFVYWQGGVSDGRFTFNGQAYYAIGSVWNKKQSLLPFDWSTFVAHGGFGEVRFDVGATEKKLWVAPASPCQASSNVSSAKISAKTSKGTVSGSFKVGGETCKFEGALYLDDMGTLKAFGGVSSKTQLGLFEID